MRACDHHAGSSSSCRRTSDKATGVRCSAVHARTPHPLSLSVTPTGRRTARLYEAVFADALANPKVFDVTGTGLCSIFFMPTPCPSLRGGLVGITVEAPAEHFQLMRDRSDVRRLRDLPEIDAFVKLPLTSKDIQEVAKRTKLSRVR